MFREGIEYHPSTTETQEAVVTSNLPRRTPNYLYLTIRSPTLSEISAMKSVFGMPNYHSQCVVMGK